MDFFYITFRYVFLNEKTYLNPNYVVNHSMAGTGVLCDYVIGDNEVDGRHLAIITHDSAVIPQSTIMEALSMYAAKVKTDADALDFAKTISGDPTLTMTNRLIDFPQPS